MIEHDIILLEVKIIVTRRKFVAKKGFVFFGAYCCKHTLVQMSSDERSIDEYLFPSCQKLLRFVHVHSVNRSKHRIRRIEMTLQVGKYFTLLIGKILLNDSDVKGYIMISLLRVPLHQFFGALLPHARMRSLVSELRVVMLYQLPIRLI